LGGKRGRLCRDSRTKKRRDGQHKWKGKKINADDSVDEGRGEKSIYSVGKKECD